MDFTSWILEGFLNGESIVDHFKKKCGAAIDLCYDYMLSVKIDSNKFRKIYFPDTDKPDIQGKTAYVMSWLAAKFDSEDDSSHLFTKQADSAMKKKAIAEKAPTALPSVQFSGKFNILESGPMQTPRKFLNSSSVIPIC